MCFPQTFYWNWIPQNMWIQMKVDEPLSIRADILAALQSLKFLGLGLSCIDKSKPLLCKMIHLKTIILRIQNPFAWQIQMYFFIPVAKVEHDWKSTWKFETSDWNYLSLNKYSWIKLVFLCIIIISEKLIKKKKMNKRKSQVTWTLSASSLRRVSNPH